MVFSFDWYMHWPASAKPMKLGSMIPSGRRYESTAFDFDTPDVPVEKYEYQAEVSRLMDLIVNNKKVFPNFYVLGWYSTGADAEESDMQIHKALMDINESPVYVLLNPLINHSQKDFPVTIYESGMFTIILLL
ncbi:JAB1/MPN/MOV34 metalloenzyme domain, Rpn11/EIF3F [Artemisia annua]|uniref:JAB1/MPN/MOV34 metalloenzyme domain, Rpn11/EIF3F n=1 Tax=Artemisia annua TaxID=35608 RepID=A0A2U1QC32_ARTAN|nr:JAB1/MPN/MOV34 metalloenzyme domain, Rpn11/EIF3F [Artemisia annua]